MHCDFSYADLLGLSLSVHTRLDHMKQRQALPKKPDAQRLLEQGIEHYEALLAKVDAYVIKAEEQERDT